MASAGRGDFSAIGIAVPPSLMWWLGNMMRVLKRLAAVAIVAVFALAGWPQSARAQTSGTWTNTAGGLWSDSGNWSGNAIADGAGATANFTSNITGTTTIGLDSSRTIGNLTFNDTVSPSAVTPWILGNNGDATNGLTLDVASGTPTITVGASNRAEISATLAGTKGLAKAGSGTLLLSASNSYSGTTTLAASSGLLVLGHAHALGGSAAVEVTGNFSSVSVGSGVSVGAGATIALISSANGNNNDGGLTAINTSGTWAGNVTLTSGRLGYREGNLVITGTVGGGNLVLSGWGDGKVNTGSQYGVTLAGPSSYTGSTGLLRGWLRLGRNDALPTGTTLDVFNTANNAAASEAATFDLNGFNQTVAVLQSTGLLTRIGHANGYVTNTSLTSGTLTVNQSTSGTYRGLLTGNVSFVKGGAGNLTLGPIFVTTGSSFVNGTNSFSGTTRVDGGTLTLSSGTTDTSLALFGSTFDTGGAGTLAIASGITAATFGGLTGSGTLALQTTAAGAVALSVGGGNASSTFAGRLTGAGGLAKVGSGTFTLTGAANDYVGNTAVSAGTLRISSTAALPGFGTAGRYSVADGATLLVDDAVDNAAVATMLGTGNFLANGRIGFDTSAGNRTYSSAITGTVGVVKIGGNTLSLTGSNSLGAIRVMGGTLAFQATENLAGSGQMILNNGAMQFNGGSSNGNLSGRTTFLEGPGRIQADGGQFALAAIQGAGQLTLGPGTALLVQNSAGTYTGGTVIEAGASIAVGVDNAFGSGSIRFEGGGLRSTQGSVRTLANNVTLAGNPTFVTSGANADRNVTFTGPVTIEGASRTVTVNTSPVPGETGIFFTGAIGDGGNALGLTKAGPGALVLGGANTYTGTTTLADGTLRLDSTGALGGGGNLSFTGGTLQYTGSNTADYASRIKGSSGSIRIDPNGQSITYAGSIDATNSGGLRLGGSGTLALSGSNGFTGTTQLAAGVLALANPDALAGSGSVAFNGGSVQYRPGGAGADISGKIRGSTAAILIDTNGENVAFAGAINNTNSGGLTKSGAGTLTLSGVNTYSGTTTVTGGTLAFTTDAALATLTGPVALGGATLAFTGTSSLNQTVAQPILLGAGGGTLSNSGANAPIWFISGSISGAGPLTVASGTGLVVFFSGNTNSGGVALQAGSQTVVGFDSVGPAGAPTSGAFGTGTLTLAGGGLRSTTGAARTVGNAVLATADTTFITAGSNDDKSITFTGPTTLSGGSRTFTVDTTGTGSPAIIFSGAISDGGNTLGLTKAGPGRMILAGVNTYTGPTVVSAGTLLVNGTQAGGSLTVDPGALLGGSGLIGGGVTVNGILAPGNSPGVLTMDSLVLGGTSTSLFEIDGLIRGTQYDGVSITGAGGPTYGGTLSLAFGNLAAFANDSTFDLFNFTGSTAGGFSSVTSTGFYPGTWTNNNDGTFKLESNSQTLTFSQVTGDIIVVPEPAALALAAIGIAAAAWAHRRK